MRRLHYHLPFGQLNPDTLCRPVLLMLADAGERMGV